MTKSTYIPIILLLCIPLTGFSQIFNKEVEASLNIQPQGQFFEIKALAYNKTSLNKSLSYRMSVVKTDTKTGESERKDSESRFILDPGQRKILVTESIKAEDQRRTVVFLLIYEDEHVIGKDRVVINGFDGEDGVAPLVVREEDIFKDKSISNEVGLLRGLVVEDTKTKPGRDFYSMFYSLYTANNINGEKMVRVEEELAVGGNTQIKVKVDQDVVVQFIVNPRAGYLKGLAEQSVAMVGNYFERLKAYKNQQQRY